MKTNSNGPQYITIGGRRAVVLEESEYRRLADLAGEGLPPLPPANARGNFPAAETIRISITRDIIHRRRALRLSQAELARRARIQTDTLKRVEQGKHVPSIATVEKLEKALASAESKSVRRR